RQREDEIRLHAARRYPAPPPRRDVTLVLDDQGQRLGAAVLRWLRRDAAARRLPGGGQLQLPERRLLLRGRHLYQGRRHSLRHRRLRRGTGLLQPADGDLHPARPSLHSITRYGTNAQAAAGAVFTGGSAPPRSTTTVSCSILPSESRIGG